VVVDPAGKPIAGARIFNANQAADDYVTSATHSEEIGTGGQTVARRLLFQI
jgi:hypothetical protein